MLNYVVFRLSVGVLLELFIYLLLRCSILSTCLSMYKQGIPMSGDVDKIMKIGCVLRHTCIDMTNRIVTEVYLQCSCANSHISTRMIYLVYLHILCWTMWCLDCLSVSLSICLGTNIGLGFIFAKVKHRNIVNKLLSLFYWSCQYMYVKSHPGDINKTEFYT
jgi:hypothetical protein